MYKKILISMILIVFLILVSLEIVAAKEILSAKIELKDGTVIIGEIPIILVKTKDGKHIRVEDIAFIWFLTETPSVNSSEKFSKETESFTWDRQEGIIITTTGNRVQRYKEFTEELEKVLLNVARWGSVSLLDFTKDKMNLKILRNNHTIFMIRPENLEELEKLEVNHADLVPVAYGELKSYSFPLLYFSRDDKGKIRGVIIADEVTPSLAGLLAKGALPLDIAFWHKDGQLREIIVGRETAHSVLPASLETVILKSPLSIICVSEGEKVEGDWDRFEKEVRKFLDASFHWRPSPVPIGKSLKWLTRNTVYFIHPKNLKCLQDLESKYPKLLPLSYDELESELESYSSPLFYFSWDIEADKVRGIVITRGVNMSLVDMLSKNIPLDIPFRYENEQLQILK